MRPAWNQWVKVSRTARSLFPAPVTSGPGRGVLPLVAQTELSLLERSTSMLHLQNQVDHAEGSHRQDEEHKKTDDLSPETKDETSQK
jgi:hypothetical protein